MNMILCACGCGQIFLKHDKRGRERRYINGHNRKGKEFTEEHRRNLSEAQKGKKREECSAWKGDNITMDAYYWRARKIYEEHHKVTLVPGVDVHHKDGDYTNNNIKNLRAMMRGDHSRLHAEWRRGEK